MRELEDTKLDSLARSVGLDQEDITRIKSSKKKEYLNKLNIYYMASVPTPAGGGASIAS